MRIKETKVYQFDELDDEAKEKARQWYREGCLDYDWWEYVYEDAATIADLMGIELRTKPVKLMGGGTRYDPCIYFSGFSSQGDGACFEGTYSYAKGCVKAVKSHAPQDKELHRIVEELAAIQKRYGYQLFARITHAGWYCHSGTMDVDVDWERGEVKDDDYLEVKQLLRDFADWIYDQLRQEYEYRMSDEVVDEEIRLNEYEFDEHGNRE